jgi:hypothetical protein
VSSSEIGFLALGLGIGSAAGAAVLAAVRSRRGSRPEVRVTITPNAIPPRAVRSAAAAASLRRTPMPGSPEEDAWRDAVPVMAAPTLAAVSLDPRIGTDVPKAPAVVSGTAVAIPIVGGPAPRLPNTVVSAPVADRPVTASGIAPGASAVVVGVAVAEAAANRGSLVTVATGDRLDVGCGTAAVAIRARPPVLEPRLVIAGDAVAIPIVAAGSRRRTGGPGTTPGAPSADLDPCADVRTTSAARCAAADTARDAARVAADALRETQRTHAALQARIEEAGATGDPRRVAAEKERLHAEFQATHGGIADADGAEAAARAWLTAVSELNARARESVARIQAGTEKLRTVAAAMERLEAEAERARVIADRAESDCLGAREELAQCEEREQAARPVPPPEGEHPFAEGWPDAADTPFDPHPTEPADLGRLPAVIRILRGDTAARETVVAALAGPDASARAEWHVRIARLTDAIAARAIEDGFVDLPDEHPFWGHFATEERREIVGALASIGFRYDGLQGFEDERVPSARDLSLAVGYAGLDRMRVRAWPAPADLAGLYAEARVAADLWLAQQADDLALARVVDALRTRASGLDEVWNAWGRVRPALLADL